MVFDILFADCYINATAAIPVKNYFFPKRKDNVILKQHHSWIVLNTISIFEPCKNINRLMNT